MKNALNKISFILIILTALIAGSVFADKKDENDKEMKNEAKTIITTEEQMMSSDVDSKAAHSKDVDSKDAHSKKDVDGKITSPAPASQEITPEPSFIAPRSGAKIKGAETIKMNVKDAVSLEFYYKLVDGVPPVYLGNGASKGGNLWEYNWDSSLTPNGKYQLFAKIANQYGEYESSKIEIEVANEVLREKQKEEKIKEDVEKAKEEVRQEEEKIEEKKKDAKEKVVEIIDVVVAQVQEILPDEAREAVKPELKTRQKEVEKAVEKNMDDLVVKVKEEKKLEKEIEKKDERVKNLDEEIKDNQQEVEKVKEVKKVLEEESAPSEEIEKVEVLETKAVEKLEVSQEEKQVVVKENQSLKNEAEKVKNEKSELKKEIVSQVARAMEPAKPAVAMAAPGKSAEVSAAKEQKENEISSQLEELEKVVKEKEEIKIEKTKNILKDSDGDGLSDETEITIGTDPFNPDSDNDGFLDGAEYGSGYDPLKPGPADKVIYQEPFKVKQVKSEIYRVERAEVVVAPSGQPAVKLEGKALPNSFVVIYIYSQPIVMTTKTDENGNWSIILEKPLSDGQHEVYVAMTNNRGEIAARSESFTFVKVGQKLAAITLGAFSSDKVASPAESLQKSFLFLVIGIITLAIGVALIVISFFAREKIYSKNE